MLHVFLQDLYTNLSLAFRTDQTTLEQRLAVHKHARDSIEKNIDVELKGLKETLEVCAHCSYMYMYIVHLNKC